jgi:hypothetical protein
MFTLDENIGGERWLIVDCVFLELQQSVRDLGKNVDEKDG